MEEWGNEETKNWLLPRSEKGQKGPKPLDNTSELTHIVYYVLSSQPHYNLTTSGGRYCFHYHHIIGEETAVRGYDRLGTQNEASVGYNP